MSSNSIAIINSMLRRLGPQDEQSAALALLTPALVFYGFRITTYDDITIYHEDDFDPDAPLMLSDGAEAKLKKSPRTNRILDTVEEEAWREKVQVFMRNAGLLVAAVRSTEFIDHGKTADDMMIFDRLDEVAQWKVDLKAFCKAADIGQPGRLSWWFIADDGGKVISVKLMLDEKPGGWR